MELSPKKFLRKIPRNVDDVSNKMTSRNFQWIDFDSFFSIMFCRADDMQCMCSDPGMLVQWCKYIDHIG